MAVRKAVEGLLEKQIPILAGFRFDRGRQGRYIAVFERKTAPRQVRRATRLAVEVLEPSAALHLDLIAQAVGSGSDAVWWTYCIRRLGCGAVDRALGQLKEGVPGGTSAEPRRAADEDLQGHRRGGRHRAPVVANLSAANVHAPDLCEACRLW